MQSLFIWSIFLLIQFISACRHGGSTYVNGQEWKERDAFIMRCTIHDNGSWKTEVVACLSPSGTRIPINTELEEGNDQWKCAVNDRGMITLIQGANPNAKCDGHDVGDRWIEKSFEIECHPGGIRQLVACITEVGQKIPVNGTKEVNGFTLVCQQFANGTVVFHGTKSGKSPSKLVNPHAESHAIKCIDETSQQRDIGEYWIENHRFNKTCRASGAVEVVNCISKDNVKIPLNGSITKDGNKYTCEMTPQGTIRFSAAPVDKKRRL